MARGKRKRKPNYLKTLVEARGLNPASLAKYLRDRFGQEAKAAEGREVLLERVVKLHATYRRPLAEAGDAPAPKVDTSTPAAPPPAASASSDVESVAGKFVDAIADRLGKGSKPKEDPLPPCDPFETYEGNTRVTQVGDFPEAAQYEVLRSYRREREASDHVYFRDANGRRVMLGKVIEIFAQEHYKGDVPVGVNGLDLSIPREQRVGIPVPLFEQLQQSSETFPVYGPEHNMPTGSQDVPPPPPPPKMGRRQSYNMGVYGDCLCDPVTLEVVVQLTEMVSSMRSMPVEDIEITGAAM